MRDDEGCQGSVDFFMLSYKQGIIMQAQHIEQEISQIFASLSEGQESLGSEFEAVWDENLDVLYQS